MLANEQGEFRLRAAHVVLRLEGINRRGVQQLAGAIDHGHLDAGADARIETHGGARSGGGGQQEILEVPCEDIDRLFFRPLTQLAHQVER